MVQHRWIKQGGREVLAEVAPAACPAGHPGPLHPGWGGCPRGCGAVGRTWTCWTDGCRTVLFDEDHDCEKDAPGRRTS